MTKEFDLWLEFEEYADGYPAAADDPECDFCNAVITIEAKRYAINVWTFAYIDAARRDPDADYSMTAPAPYLLPPDLLVERLDRDVLEAAIQVLLKRGLPNHWAVDEENDEHE